MANTKTLKVNDWKIEILENDSEDMVEFGDVEKGESHLIQRITSPNGKIIDTIVIATKNSIEVKESK